VTITLQFFQVFARWFLPYNPAIIPKTGESIMHESRKLRAFVCSTSQGKPANCIRAAGWIYPWPHVEKLLPGLDWNFDEPSGELR
jgi:hypothetical protein